MSTTCQLTTHFHRALIAQLLRELVTGLATFLLTRIMFLSSLLLGVAAATHVHAASSSFPAGVIATGTQGVTNPPVPTMPTTINQTSMARLLSLNSIDDFCIFAPPSLNTISETEVGIGLTIRTLSSFPYL